jgi:hypothetical protein
MPHNSVKPKGMDQCRYPVDYFLEIFGQATFDLLLEQTNIHRLDVNKKIIRISMGELRQAVGILMYMSVISMPNMRLFWKKSNNITAVSKVMTRDRFFEIVNCLHLSNNHLQPARGELGYDKLFKVRQLLTLLNINFQNHAEMEKVVSVDEQMIPYKGTVRLKVYMKNKPSKWGIKVRYCKTLARAIFFRCYNYSKNCFLPNLSSNSFIDLGIGWTVRLHSLLQCLRRQPSPH